MSQKERWATRIGLVLAMAGNAVGLGNFLRFPAQAASNGGGAFLIPYIIALLVLGLPLMWVEWSMGRFGGQHGHHSTPGIFHTMGQRPFWKYLGVFGLWANLMIASFYLYIESWTMAYAGFSLYGGFKETSAEVFYAWLTGEKVNSIIAASRWGMVLFTICICLNVWILSRGLAKGIEIVSKVGMPLLIVFAAVLAVRGLFINPTTDDKAVESALVGLNYVWEPNFSALLNPAVWLAAAGQIFFTLSIGMGSIHCYASYLREQDDVALTGASAAWTNEFCEIVLGGSILIPIAVAYLGLGGIQERSGFALGFLVFPGLFQNWGGFAPLAGFMWFGLLFFAAVTSSLAMGQPILSFLQDEFKLTRGRAAVAFGGMLLPLALGVALLHQKSFFDEFDYWAGSFGLVVFAFIETILFGWVFGIDRGWAEIQKGAELRVPMVFKYVIKYVTPLFLFVILTAYAFKPAAGWDAHLAALAQGKSAPKWEWAGDGMIGRLLHRDLDPAGAKTEAERVFLGRLQVARTADRLAMIGVFGLFCVLVSIAWRKRAREGRA